jgi:two-component system CitB family sensor kinase
VKSRLPLAYQILALQVGIVILSAVAGTIAAFWQARQQLDQQYEQRALAIAQSVASMDAVKVALMGGDPGGTIQRTAEEVRRSTGATYVVVTDRRGIRFSHPNPSRIGQHVSEDPSLVLAGHTWVGIQDGTLGSSARGKAPIFRDGQVIGMTSVGFLEEKVGQQAIASLPGYAVTVAVALALGVAGSLLLARRLKRQIFGLEPYEIAGLFEEREASLLGIGEGAIATDRGGRITLVNDEARRLLGLGSDCVGRKPAQLLPPGRLLEFLSGGLRDQDEVVLAGERVLVASRREVKVRNHEIGHIITVRDATELARLSRGVGVESLTDALRAQAHEYSNRLHTIAGLIELGRADEAMQLIAQTSGAHQELSEALLERVGDPVLGALLLAKATVAAERGIEFRVTDNTMLTRSWLENEDLITLVGNLVDNALDAAAGSDGERWVQVSIVTQAAELVIEVRDSGAGVPPELAERVFQEGYSSKAPPARRARGFGLALVSQVVNRLGGRVEIHNEGGAVFTVRLPAPLAVTA